MYQMELKNYLPIIVSTLSITLFLVLGILQFLGAPPFVNPDYTYGWIYISLAVTLVGFFSMYMTLFTMYLFDAIFTSPKPTLNTDTNSYTIDMQEIDLKEIDLKEIDLKEKSKPLPQIPV